MTVGFEGRNDFPLTGNSPFALFHLEFRLLEPIGNIPPAEAEERYYAMLDEPAIAA
jgi:hypothetical protein